MTILDQIPAFLRDIPGVKAVVNDRRLIDERRRAAHTEIARLEAERSKGQVPLLKAREAAKAKVEEARLRYAELQDAHARAHQAVASHAFQSDGLIADQRQILNQTADPRCIGLREQLRGMHAECSRKAGSTGQYPDPWAVRGKAVLAAIQVALELEIQYTDAADLDRRVRDLLASIPNA